MDIEQFRKAGYAAIDAICDYYQTLAERPVKARVEPGYLIEQLPHHPPAEGESFQQITSDFQSLILPGITHWQHPSWFAYFPSISTFESMLGELYSASVANPGFNWICSPACTELEQVVVDWMASLFGLDEVFHTRSKVGGGVILTSASDACLTAAIAARERALRQLTLDTESTGTTARAAGEVDVPLAVREGFSQKLVMYGSTQTHSLAAKAALMLGVTFRAVAVSEHDEYALRGQALKDAIDADVAQGFVPFFVVATVGTTSSGAVDRIGEIGEVLKGYPTTFLHVDAAWAGVAYALPDRRSTLRLGEVNEYADSFSTNAHKWGLVGFDCALFYVRDRHDLTRALDVTPVFLRSTEGDAGTVIDYRNWQISLGRRFRSVKLWFVMRSYGSRGFQAHLEKSIALAEQLEATVKKSPMFEIVTPRNLALVVVRLRPSTRSWTDDELNLLNQRLHTRLSLRHDVFLTQTILHGVEREIFCIRIAVGNPGTAWTHISAMWDILEAEGANVLQES